MLIEKSIARITLTDEERKALSVARDILATLFDEMDCMGLNETTLFVNSIPFDSSTVEAAGCLCNDLSISTKAITIEVK